jgi:heme-degrading monooxygenase HmoA
MFARVSRYEVSTEQLGAAPEAFRQAIGQIGELSGLAEAFLLVDAADRALADADSARVLTMTLWESRTAMEASRVTATRLRGEAAQALEGSVISSEEFEVAVREHGHAN